MKQLILSVTKDDLEWEFCPCGGNGGQKQNKTSSGARCRHVASGAVGESREERSQVQNKRTAFKRMANSAIFMRWLRVKTAEIMAGETVEQWADDQMKPENLKTEIKVDGKWTESKDLTD